MGSIINSLLDLGLDFQTAIPIFEPVDITQRAQLNVLLLIDYLT